MALSIDRLIDHRDDEHHDDDEGTSDVVVAKAVAMVVLFFASMIFGLTPMFLAKKFKWIGEGQTAADIKSSNKIVLVLLSFGGGVLLCTTFMHLLPEVGENVRSLQENGTLGELPFHLEALLTCAGFFAMYFVEEAVHFYLHKRAARRTSAPPDSALMRSLSIRHSRNNANNNHPEFGVKDPEKSQLPDAISTIEQSVAKANGDHHHHHHHEHKHDHDHSNHGHSHGHSHMPVMEGDDDPVIASLRGLLIVLALSVHELFEGLAVGLESTAGNVWYMFGAVSAHKLVIAFCVGVELVTVKTKTSLCVVYITTFAIVSPLGIGIGIAMAGGGGAAASGISSVILQGLASGTLLYVVFFEILQRDRAGLVQFISALVGFLVMFGLQFATGHEHAHDHDHSSTSAADPASLGHGHSHSHGHGHSH